MDSSGLQSSTSIASNGENDKKDSTMIQSKPADIFKTYKRQSFSLPDSIMLYIAKNPPTLEFYQKMIQTCKELFVKNPVLVISDLDYCADKLFFDDEQFDLDNRRYKFWITHQFRVQPHHYFVEVNAPSIIPKIFRCDFKSITLDDQIISFAELCFLVSSAEEIWFDNVIVKDENGTNVEIEKIVEVAVEAKQIGFDNAFITSKSMKKLIEIPRFCKLKSFDMEYISETFDIEAFYVYMKKNKRTSFYLRFRDSISDEYKNRLEEIVDEIIATETHGYKPPNICFPGIPRAKAIKLELIWVE